MFENRKLKKAKAKLELIEVQKKLDEIESEKESERWEQMPLWEKNIETEILRGQSGTDHERYSNIVSIILATLVMILFLGGGVFAIGFLGLASSLPSTINGWILNLIPLILFGAFFWIEFFSIFSRGYGHY